jgi:glycosyltransferase involved in cell wall biosynthesis
LNILIVSQYFWPEHFIINDLALKLKEQGHTVTIFTGKPNYPEGETYPGYSSSDIQEECYSENINVFRVPLRPRKNGGRKNLTLNYLSFVFSGLRHSFRFSKNKEFDVIFVFVVSPITAVIPAILLKWLTKSHLAIWVQDLWPESIRATGFIRNRFILGCVRGLVRGIYYFSDTILAQSKGFIPHILPLANKNKVFYYPNSVVDNVCEQIVYEELPLDLIELLETQFCIVFAGNIGTAQSVETIVTAAEKLKDEPNIKIVLVGSGSKISWIEQQVAERNISNLVLVGRYPASEMPFIFSKAAGLLVTLKSNEIFSFTIPSKIQSYLAAGRPIIAALNGEGANIIREAGAGLVSPSEDPDKLAEAIKQLYHLPNDAREEMGRSGRAYFLSHFEMDGQCRRLIQILENRLKLQGQSV